MRKLITDITKSFEIRLINILEEGGGEGAHI